MNPLTPKAFSRRQLWRTTGLILVIWTLVVAASMVWNVRLMRDAILEASITDARSNFDMAVLYRHWAMMHGGVYVPVTAFTPPNPYLTNMVERDLVTPSGRRLTLMNPTYMTRQVLELEARESGRQGHITSLKPLRPENAPDAWEAAALQAFAQGRTEVSSRVLLHNKPYLRLMKPLVNESSCLKCHASLGNQEGGIRGGISIAVPLDPYLALEQARAEHIAGTHAGLWSLGVLGLFLSTRQLRQRWDQQLQTDEKLRQSEEKFRTVADWTCDMETWRGPDGRFLYVSPSAEVITGYRAEEFLADPKLTLKITHPDDVARVTEHHRKFSQPGNVVCSMDFRILTRGGEERWLNHYCQPVYGADGRWLGQRSSNRDITERKRIEDRLRQVADRLALAARAGGVGIWDYDVVSNHLAWDSQMFHLYGITRGQFSGAYEAWCARVHPEDRKRSDEEVQLALRGEKDFSSEFRVLWPDGSIHEIRAIATVERDASGKAVRMIGTNWDITERKQMDEKIRQLSVAVEQSPASIVITNTAGDMEYVNPKFIELTGYTPAEVLGKNPRVLKSGEKSPDAYRELWKTISAGNEWRGEFHNKKKNGEFYWEFASISPIRDAAGRVTHYVAVKEDITARKKTEADRDQLIQELQKALANVKALSGLLPICAGCKKIRDDKGYWNQVENYIQKHSEAKFSHGMCPDCLKKWYPELVEAGLGDSSKKIS
jgi:PAS domain S-box-containing protein